MCCLATDSRPPGFMQSLHKDKQGRTGAQQRFQTFVLPLGLTSILLRSPLLLLDLERHVDRGLVRNFVKGLWRWRGTGKIHCSTLACDGGNGNFFH